MNSNQLRSLFPNAVNVTTTTATLSTLASQQPQPISITTNSTIPQQQNGCTIVPTIPHTSSSTGNNGITAATATMATAAKVVQIRHQGANGGASSTPQVQNSISAGNDPPLRSGQSLDKYSIQARFIDGEFSQSCKLKLYPIW